MRKRQAAKIYATYDRLGWCDKKNAGDSHLELENERLFIILILYTCKAAIFFLLKVKKKINMFIPFIPAKKITFLFSIQRTP